MGDIKREATWMEGCGGEKGEEVDSNGLLRRGEMEGCEELSTNGGLVCETNGMDEGLMEVLSSCEEDDDTVGMGDRDFKGGCISV